LDLPRLLFRDWVSISSDLLEVLQETVFVARKLKEVKPMRWIKRDVFENIKTTLIVQLFVYLEDLVIVSNFVSLDAWKAKRFGVLAEQVFVLHCIHDVNWAANRFDSLCFQGFGNLRIKLFRGWRANREPHISVVIFANFDDFSLVLFWVLSAISDRVKLGAIFAKSCAAKVVSWRLNHYYIVPSLPEPFANHQGLLHLSSIDDDSLLF